MTVITGTNKGETIDEAARGGIANQGSDIMALGGDDLIIALRKTPYFNGSNNPIDIVDTINGGSGTDTYRVTLSNSWTATTGQIHEFFGGGLDWFVNLTAVEAFDITAATHGSATLGGGNDRIDARGATGAGGNYSTGAGDDVVLLSRATVTADLGVGNDRLVIDQTFNNARTYLSVPLSGDLASGYSGTYRRSDGASTYATFDFSGVEHFTITTGIGGDTLVTGDGDDILSTGAGADLISAGAGRNVIDGGDDIDALGIDFSGENAGVVVDLRLSGAQQTAGTGSITGVESFFGAVTGTDFADVLIEGNYAYNAQISAGAGDDFVQVSRGTDTIDLGVGNDRLVLDHTYNDARTNLTVALSGSLATGYSGTYRHSDGASVYADTFFSGVENFTILTAGGGDTIGTGDGNDVISTGAGVDLITAGKGNDQIDGGADVDALSIDFSDESAGVTVNLLASGAQQSGGTGSITGIESFMGAVTGSAFDDVLIEGIYGYDAQFATGAGNDLVQISRGTDSVDLGAGNDRLVLDHSYNNARTYLTVGLSGDLANGYSGEYRRSDGASTWATVAFSGVENFTITTAGGNDTIQTGDGDDVISTGAGIDLITAGKGVDQIDGGADVDALSIDLSGQSAGVTIDLLQTGAQQTGGAGSVANIESFSGVVIGTAFNDVLTEGKYAYDAQFSTGAGDDLVQVSRGADTVDLGEGNDRLVLDYSAGRIYVSTALSGSLASGYSGQFYVSGGGSEYARTTFANVENFTILGSASTDVITTGDGDDIVSGGAGNDTISVGKGLDQVDGGADIDTLQIDFSGRSAGVRVDLTAAGAQQSGGGGGSITGIESFAGTITGTRFADTFIEGVFAYDATFNTGAGNDLVQVSRGEDVVNMGDGSDRLVLDYRYNTTSARAYNNIALSGTLASGYSGEFYVQGPLSRVTFSGVEAFTILSGSGNDALTTGDGDDVIDGGAGDDVLNGAGGKDVLTGGLGNDTLDGGAGIDRLTGGIGDDRYYVDNAKDRIVELLDEGYDRVFSTVSYRLSGNVEALTLTGTGASKGIGNDLANVLTGNDAANVLRGLGGDDTLIGGGGNDTLNGGTGADMMTGGSGDDTYFVDNAGDVVTEGANAGLDSVRSTIDYTLGANLENLTLSGAARSGTGNALANRITGSNGSDTLSGLDGDDTLLGGGGADRIDGGAGNDSIAGGARADTLTGGTGADLFRFATGDTGATLAAADLITDFSHAEGDRISLAGIDAIAGTPENDTFRFLGTAAFSGTAGELRYAFSGAETLIQGDTNGDGIADLIIRLTGNVALVAGDFAGARAASAFVVDDMSLASAHPASIDTAVALVPVENGLPG